MPDGMEKNLSVVREQLADYRTELVIIRRRLRIAIQQKRFSLRDDQNVWHILLGVVEEWFDKCPRPNTYLWLIRVPWRITVLTLAVAGLRSLL